MTEVEQPEDFGLRLQRLIRERRCRFKEISHATGIPLKTIHEWVGSRGRMPRDPTAVMRLADYFGVSLDYLLAGRVPPKEPPQQNPLPSDWERFELFLRRLDAPQGKGG